MATDERVRPYRPILHPAGVDPNPDGLIVQRPGLHQ